MKHILTQKIWLIRRKDVILQCEIDKETIEKKAPN